MIDQARCRIPSVAAAAGIGDVGLLAELQTALIPFLTPDTLLSWQEASTQPELVRGKDESPLTAEYGYVMLLPKLVSYQGT